MIQKTTSGYVKIGAIPVLLGIVYVVFPGKPPALDHLASEPNAVAIDTTSHAEAQKTSEAERIGKIRWPEFQLSDLKNCNPFDRRTIFPELAAKSTESESSASDRQSFVAMQSQTITSKLEPLKVQAVFQSSQGIAALVGDRVFHVGDLLDDGTMVTSITPEQLIVALPGVN